MSNDLIKISNIELELKKDFITDEKKIAIFLEKAKDLKKQVFDFSTDEGIKQAKELKTQVNKSITELDAFCAPLEEDGKKIAKARSLITTTLKTGKEAIIDQILAPVKEREDKIKSLKDKLFIPSLDANSNESKLKEIEELESYEWLAFKEEATGLVTRQKEFLTNEKIKFDEEARLKKEAEEKERLKKEEEIRIAAENKAKEEAQKLIDEANKKVEAANEQIKEIKSKYLQPASTSSNESHQAKIHNEILEDLSEFHSGSIQEAKYIITAIAKGKIRNLTIKY